MTNAWASQTELMTGGHFWLCDSISLLPFRVLLQTPFEQGQHRGFFGGEVGEIAGEFFADALGQVVDQGAVEIRVEDSWVDVALAADGFGVAEALRDGFHRGDDVLLRLALAGEFLQFLQRPRREHRAGPRAEIL